MFERPTPRPRTALGSEEPRPTPVSEIFMIRLPLSRWAAMRDIDRFPAGLHAVAQGIFQQGLEDELRDERIVQCGVDVVADTQFFFVALLHQIQIQMRDLQFIGERDFVRARGAQRQAQQIAELREHHVGGFHVFIHHRRNRVQRIEEEMRLELEAQIFELRFGELRFQLRGGELLGLREAEFSEVVVEADDAGESDEVVGELHRIAIEHDAVVVGAEADQRRDELARDRP